MTERRGCCSLSTPLAVQQRTVCRQAVLTLDKEGMGHDAEGHVVRDFQVVRVVHSDGALEAVVDGVCAGEGLGRVLQQVQVDAVAADDQALACKRKGGRE